MRILWLTLILFSGFCRADDKYYVVMFGYQDGLNHMKLSHTFAAYVKVDDTGAPPTTADLHVKAISWLPADFAETLDLNLVKAVRGRNFSIGETLAFAKQLEPRGVKAAVIGGGAFPTTKELYEKADKMGRFLDANGAFYKVSDGATREKAFEDFQRFDPKRPQDLPRERGAFHCVHPVMDLAGFERTVFRHGYQASSFALDHYLKTGQATPRPDQAVLDLLMKKVRKESQAAVASPDSLATH